jgi:hypothetical protein
MRCFRCCLTFDTDVIIITFIFRFLASLGMYMVHQNETIHMASPKICKTGATCRPHRITIQQRCMAAQQARVAPEKSTSEWLDSKIEMSNRGAVRQSCTSEMKGGDIVLELPAFRLASWSLIPRKDKGSRRACEAGTFRDEFLSGVQGEESSLDIFRVVHMDHSQEVQDPVLPAYQVRQSSSFHLKLRPRSFQARPFGLPLANSLVTKTQRAIYVPNASKCLSPSTTPRREIPRLPMLSPTLKKPKVFEDCTCKALPQDLMFPVF